MSGSLSSLSCLPLAVALIVSLASVASAENRDVTITHASSHAMIAFFTSNTGTNNWEEDILGVDVPAVDGAIDVTIDDGCGYCVFDFDATFADGSGAVMTKIDVRAIPRFDFTD
ncbi:hypothetical protein [Aurantimonas marianensis]|uniref:Uncharacterized protein n=1 Tax=Aurantimonas marianensis TaxID=2920428 RepID=A0A9X2KGD6_9HYPH|nr:hypothetical protein [Aurantimonas marianensis]MCP3056724.1 hypothetical protein [Aurantimonas marianensis]